jgi:hypothetical protein
MNIIEARQQMMAGKRITRKIWNNAYWYYLHGAIHFIRKYYSEYTDTETIRSGVVGSLRQDAIFAEDYEIYEGKEYE